MIYSPNAILFDLDNTLLECTTFLDADLLNKVLTRILNKKTAQAKAFSNINFAFEECMKSKEDWKFARDNKRELRRKVFLEQIKNVGFTNSPEIIQASDFYNDELEARATVISGVKETLAFLVSRKIKLGIIANGREHIQFLKIKRSGLEKFFDAIFVEGKEGFGKPDPRFYNLATNRLKSQTLDTWVVGDSIDWEVIAPKKLGFFSVWVDYWKEGIPSNVQPPPDEIISSVPEIKELLKNVNKTRPAQYR
jgi:putative hydrolase of the HAD superfamily